MTELDETTLHEHLQRRAQSRLSREERGQILEAVSADTRRLRRQLTPRATYWLGGAAGVAALVIVLAATSLLPGPRATPSSVPSPPPGSSAATAPTLAPTGPPIAELAVANAQQVSDMIGNPRWVGTVVLARARLGHIRSTLMCHAPELCTLYFLRDVSGPNVVAIGWLAAPEGEGERYEDESGVRWLRLLGLPDADAGLLAFRIQEEWAEYLGPVVETGDDQGAWGVSDVLDGDHADPSDDLYAVDGWLVATSPVSCPAPPDYGSGTVTSYWCGGSWITQAKTYTVDASRTTFQLQLDGLHVQGGAYNEFAPSPAEGPRGHEPNFGRYLVRSVGCPPAVMGECPVWSMVGRLDPVDVPTATPPPAPPGFPEEIDGETVLTADEVPGHVATIRSADPFLVGGWVNSVTFDCATDPNLPITPLLEQCDGGYRIARNASDFTGQFRLVVDDVAVPTGQVVVLRVHAYDPRAAECPDNYRARCESAIVVDQVVWPPPDATPTELIWAVEPFQAEVGAQPAAIAEVDGRLIVTGSDRDGPAAWYSDDEGTTWSHASIGDDDDARSRALGTVVGNNDLLLSAGWVQLGANDADRTSVLWASTDLGATWLRIENASVPPRIHDLVGGGSGFVAVGNANPSNGGLPDLEDPHAAIWVSANGQDWEQLPDDGLFQLARIEAIAEQDGLLVAVGWHGFGEFVLPAAWTSLDGREWRRKDLSESIGAAYAIASSPLGFIAVGISGAREAGAASWLSTDGVFWTDYVGEAIGTTALGVAANASGFVAIGTARSGRIHGWIWANSHMGGSSSQTVDAAVHDLVATDFGFVGVGRSCGPNADCPDISKLVFGRPAE